MKNFDEVIEVFGNPEEFKKRITEFKNLVEELNKKLGIIGKWEEVEDNHSLMVSIKSNTEAQYKRAEKTYSEAKNKAEQLIETALESVKDVEDSSRLREHNIGQREAEMSKREAEFAVSLNKEEKTLAEILSKTSYLEITLKEKAKEVEEEKAKLASKLVQVNKILG